MNIDSWESLEQRALWLLAHPDQGSPQEVLQGMSQMLRLWCYRRRGSFIAWSILLPSDRTLGKRALVREVAWNRPLDRRHDASTVGGLKRRHSSHPTLRTRDAEVDQGELAPFLDWAAGLSPGWPGPSLPPTSAEDIYGLEGFQFLTHLRLEWMGDGPAEWTSIRRRFNEFVEFLAAELKEREIQS